MEREILFRGKRIDNGEWITGIYDPENKAIISYFEIDSFDPCCDLMNCKAVVHKVIPETVGEYTGLTDENGVKIFEGDTVKAYFPHKYDFVKDEFIEKIEFRYGCFWFGSWNFIDFLDKLRNNKVIGNIHDNPEYIK